MYVSAGKRLAFCRGGPKVEDTTTAVLSMSSREIAELVESRHDNVKITIERLVARGVITSPATQEKATAGRPAVEYLVGKRDSYIIVAQLSPEFTARLVHPQNGQQHEAGQPPSAHFSRL